jgi:general secretion pathway protein D
MGIGYFNKTRLLILCLFGSLLLSSCATESVIENPAAEEKAQVYKVDMSQQDGINQGSNIAVTVNDSVALQDEANTPAAIQGDIEFLNNASGDVFDLQGFRRLLQAEERPSGIVLNFEDADIKEVVALVIGKILKQNYLIDPAVKGQVTLKTERPLNRNTVFYMLENILDLYGARIVKRTGHYRIFPKGNSATSALGFGEVDDRAKLGYGYRIVSLQYVSAGEMVKILESVTDKETIIRADEARNLIILGGTSEDVRNMLNAITMFDVDWMKGTNVGLIQIKYSNANDVLEDLQKVLASNQLDTESGGIMTLQSIERLNSIMIITRQYSYLRRVEDWIRKLDVPTQGAGSRLYVYQVKNLTATELAAALGELFGTGEDQTDIVDDEDVTGPGSMPVVLTEPFADEAVRDTVIETDEIDTSPKSTTGIQIIAAEDTNSLLISATPVQYAKIELALSKLDVPPLQVLLEVTIMDVALKDEFSYGMQWFLEHGDGGDGSYAAIIGDSLSFAQTFSYTGVWGDVRVLLGLLATDGRVDVLSSPSILVRNNHKASIRVGDQQPISTSVLNETGTIIASSVVYRDTGILLEIQPSITTNGTINVELSQEVVDVGDIDAATGQRTFLNRNLNTTVSVKNGETIILGGLIRSNQAVSKSGVPGLRDIPGIGFLFGKTVTADTRTELLMIMSPRIIRNPQENNEVLKEYKSKFSNLEF